MHISLIPARPRHALLWVVAVVFALIGSMALVAVPGVARATEPVGTSTGISVTSSGDTVLAGGSGRVTVNATNTDGVDLYNATAVVVLPVGVSYVAGTATPGAPNGIGEPVIQWWTPNADDPDSENPHRAQVLVWENIADLPEGASVRVSFAVEADDERYPVGASFPVGSGVYAHSNERVVPTVEVPSSGAPLVNDATEGGSVDATATVIALSLSKAETANAEAEVYRGEANPATFTVTVRTAPQAGTDGVVVEDLVPATFTVLDCETADFVCSIVEIDGEVFTKLTWTLGDLGAGETIPLTYRAFVALNEVTLPDADEPGSATRPTTGGYAVTNTASARGAYTGDVLGGGSPQIATTAEATVTVLDVGIVKSVAGGEFVSGSTKGYSFTVRTSEYIDAAAISVVDTIPDGMCPVIPAGTALTGDDWPDECAAAGDGSGEVTGEGAMESVHFDGATGRFTATFSVEDRDEDQDATVGYSVYMRYTYQDGRPTSVGDVFTNSVELTGTVRPVDSNSVDSGLAPGANDSSATIGTTGVALRKTVWTNEERAAITGVAGGATSCDSSDAYSDPSGADVPALQLNDLACFRIEATFPDGVATRDVIVSDFLPLGATMIAWSATAGAGWTTVTAIGDEPESATRWQLGEPAAGSHYVAPGDALELYVLARIDSVPAVQPRVTGNLAKLRYTSGDGSIVALRDDVDLRLAPAPPLSLDKRVNGQESIAPVQEGQELDFTIEVSHDGTSGGLNDYPLDEIEVWDVLPAGFDCDDILVADPAIAASDCVEREDGRVVVVWVLDLSGAELRGGESTTISYTLEVPSPLSIESAHTNVAAVTRFMAVSTNGLPGAEGATFHPTNPVGAFPDQPKNAAMAADAATITLAGATVDKAVVTTSVDGAGNSDLGQATIGETVTWRYAASIPAKTSIFNGVLDEQPPAAARWVPVGEPTLEANVAIAWASGCERVADQFRLCTDPASGDFGTLLFPIEWTNEGSSPAEFAVTLTMRVTDVAGNAHGSALINTAVLTSTPSIADAGAVTRASDSAQVTIVVADPRLAKQVSLQPDSEFAADVTAAGGQTVYYRLTASNVTDRPALHDVVVVDCLPSSVTVGALPADVAGPVAGTGDNGCAVGEQRLTWTLPASLVSGSNQVVTYPVTLPDEAVSGTSYLNTARLSGTTLAGDQDGERVLTTAPQTATVDIRRPSVTKTSDRVSPGNVYVAGESVTWTVTATIPAHTTFHNAALTDALPTVFAAQASGVVPVCSSPDGLCAQAEVLPAASGSIGLSLGTIEAADEPRTVTMTFTVVVPTAAPSGVGANYDSNQSVSNTAVLRWNHTAGADPANAAITLDDASASAPSTISLKRPAVSVAKAVARDGGSFSTATSAAQAETFTYRVIATASSASQTGRIAYNVVVEDQVPAGIIVDEDTISGDGVYTGGVIRWVIPQLNTGTGGAQTFTYQAQLAPAAQLTGSGLQNRVGATQWDSLASGGRTYTSATTSTATVTPAFPRVDTSKTQVTGNPVYIGDPVTFTVTLTNNGGATAASMNAVDVLPAGWSYIEGSTVIDAVAAADPASSGQTLTWSGLGSLAPGQSRVITYTAVASDGVAVGSASAHTNTASAASVTDATGGTSYAGGSYIGTTGQATARIHQADLSITKTAGTFTAGATGTFELVVRNATGSDPAVGVTVSDTLDLPEGVTFLSASGSGWLCGTPDADGALTCERTVASSTLAGGAAWPAIIVTVSIESDVVEGTEVPNIASVTARTEDRTPGNNTSEATGVVSTSADLAVSKVVVSPATGAVTAGEAIEWSITLTNLGPSVSRGSADAPIVLTDLLPAGVSDVQFVGDHDGCTITGVNMSCEISRDLTVGDTLTVALSGVVDSDVAAGADVIVNTASVTPVTDDPVSANNSATARTDVVVREDLTVVKTVIDPAPPSAVTPGEKIGYRVEIGNRGPSDARGVFVVDTLPAATTFDEITEGGADWSATVSGATVRFDLAGDLAAGAEAPVLEYTVTLAPGFVGDSDDLVNTATVSSPWRAEQQTDTAQPGPAEPTADLELTKTVRPSDGTTSVRAGETALYTLTVDNLGPSDAGAVTLTDTLPTGLSFVAPLPSGCEADGRELSCVKTEGLDAAESAWVTDILVRVDASFQGSVLTNSATVESVTPDADPSNNVADVDLDVIQRAHLTVTKQASLDEVRAGDDVVWTIIVANEGPSDAQNVTVSDVIDSRLELVEVDGATCSGTTSVSCTVGTLPADGEVVITLTTTVRSSVADGATVTNTATAVSTTIDTVTGDPTTATDDDTIDVIALSELTISKTALTATVDAGGNAVFRIAVGNDGPSDAASVVAVTDTLPDGFTFVSAATIGGPAQWSCHANGQDVVCELQDAVGDPVSLAAGAEAPELEIVASVASSQPAGPVVNTATVEAPTEPTPPSNDAEVEVVTFADLGITKAGLGTPVAGERYTWTIQVTNHGPSDSVATVDDPIVVTDVLPEGLAYVSGAGAECDAVDATVTCEIDSTLAAGDSVVITVIVEVAEDVSGALSNTATVVPGATPEPASPLWPNEATAVTGDVIEEADLGIEKTVVTDDADIIAGQAIQWRLTVTNHGPSNSDADADAPIVVTDTMPSGVTATAVTPPSADWSCTIAADGGSLRCESTTDLPTTTPQVFLVDAEIAPDVQGIITNVATVTPGLTAQPSDALDNDIDTASSAVAESADLRLMKDVRSPIVAGATGTYLLQVYNAGPSAARDVEVVDTLPAELTFVRALGADGDASAWTCQVNPTDPTEVTCSYPDAVSPGPDPIELVLEVAASSDLTGSVTNHASVTSSTPDDDDTNNHDGVTGLLATTADLRLAKTHDAEEAAVAGSEFTWTLTVTNEGPSDSVATVDTPIVVTDVLPAGFSFVAEGSDAACSADIVDPQSVVCEVTETIESGASVELAVRVALDADLEGDATNTASVVAGATADPDLANNTAVDSVAIVEVADLSIVKEVLTEASDIVAGREISWSVVVTNLGPSNSDATEEDPITVVDVLPEGVTFVSAAGDGWVCEASSGAEGETVVCEHAEDLGLGDAPTITITGLIGPDVQGSVRNVATVIPGLTPNDGDEMDTDDAVADVAESADLALSKAVSQTITAGASGAYTLVVTNFGPSSARGVTVLDTLPEGLTYRAVTGDGWSCDPVAGSTSEVLCAYDGVLAPAVSTTFELDVDADAELTGDIVNTAVVEAVTSDPEPANDTATAPGTIAEVVDLAITKTAVGAPVIGETFAYELAVTNSGPSVARGIRVEDPVPAGLEVVGIDGDGWQCALDAATGRTVCALDELAVGQTAPVITVEVRVLPAAYPEVSNTATVTATSPEAEATLVDNTSTATVVVPASSDLVITKTLLDELVTGDQARYELIVRNEGATEDPGPITVIDELPDGLSARSWTVEGAVGACETVTSVYTCTIDGLDVGQSVTLILTVDVASTAVGTMVNTASVSSSAGEQISEDSAAGDVTVVDLPSTGGVLGPYLPFGVALLLLGLGAVFWARRESLRRAATDGVSDRDADRI